MRARLLALLVLLSALTAFGQDGALTDIRPKPATYGLDREQEPVRGRCVAVIDGDTIRVLTVDQQLLRVRLAFIDAPERRQAFGTRAKQAMSDLVFGHEVTLYPHAIDRYGRTVAIVYADDKDIGLEMLKAGLAWPYYRYLLQAPASVQESYRQAADTAQEQRLGLWSDLNPMPPWEWRKGEKETLEDGTGRVLTRCPGLCYADFGYREDSKEDTNSIGVSFGQHLSHQHFGDKRQGLNDGRISSDWQCSGEFFWPAL